MMKMFSFEFPMGTGVPPFCTQLAFPTVDAACEWAMEELDKHDADLAYLQEAGEGERVLDRSARGYVAVEWDWWDNDFHIHHIHPWG